MVTTRTKLSSTAAPACIDGVCQIPSLKKKKGFGRHTGSEVLAVVHPPNPTVVGGGRSPNQKLVQPYKVDFRLSRAAAIELSRFRLRGCSGWGLSISKETANYF